MVGTSGRNEERRAPVTARVRSAPDRAKGRLSLTGLMLAGTWPPRRSCSAGAPPGQCRGVVGTPAPLASIMPTNGGVPPAEVVPYDAFPGFALHHCTKSARLFTPSGTTGPIL